MIDDKTVKQFSKQYHSLEKTVDKLYDAYNDALYKQDCPYCKKLGDPVKVLLEHRHDKCGDCPKLAKVAPIHKKLLAAIAERSDFINHKYAPYVHRLLSETNPMIHGPRGIKENFLSLVGKDYSRVKEKDKELIVSIAEDDGLYHIAK